jgi:hypothetical protein
MPYLRTLIAALVERYAAEWDLHARRPQSGPLRPDAPRVPLALPVGDWEGPGWRHPDGAAGS